MQKTDVNPVEAKQLLDNRENYIYLDVRTPAEFEAGHVPGAINVSFADIDPASGQMQARPEFLGEVQAKFPRDSKFIVGCKSGGRSAYASEMLRSYGYANVLNMVGGFGGVTGRHGEIEEPGWSTLGYPVEKETPGGTTNPNTH